MRWALRYRWLTLAGCGLVVVAGIVLYGRLESEFLPEMDEGGFVIDYHTPYGTSLAETNRQLLQAEEILRATPEVESYSRRTGARLALAIAEPNTGDFLVKLKPDRRRHTQDVIAELRAKFRVAIPGTIWEFPGILSDLIGDLTWSPNPIEVKVFSTDAELSEKDGSGHRQATRSSQGRRRRFRWPRVHGAHAEPARALAWLAALRPYHQRRGGRGQHGHARPDFIERARGRPRREHPRARGWREHRRGGDPARIAVAHRRRQPREALAGRRRRSRSRAARTAPRGSAPEYCRDRAPRRPRPRQCHGGDPQQTGRRQSARRRE